jgi:hypothetical protein
MLEPPSAFEMFLVASNYASRLTNIKNKTPGASRAFPLSESCAVAKEKISATAELSLGACSARAYFRFSPTPLAHQFFYLTRFLHANRCPLRSKTL